MGQQHDIKFEDLNLGELIRRCQVESKHYLAGHPYDETYSLELFHRALFKQDQEAWQSIYAQYQILVTDWIWRHSKFRRTSEEPGFFVNAAFISFWHSTSKPELALKFNHLGQFLRYLKCCVHSAIEDEYRRRQRQPQDIVVWEELLETLVDDASSLEERIISQAKMDDLQQAVLKQLRSGEEEVVASLSWLHGLSPQEIQAHRPDLFADVRRVYRVKRKILNRLRRDPELWKFWRKMG